MLWNIWSLLFAKRLWTALVRCFPHPWRLKLNQPSWLHAQLVCKHPDPQKTLKPPPLKAWRPVVTDSCSRWWGPDMVREEPRMRLSILLQRRSNVLLLDTITHMIKGVPSICLFVHRPGYLANTGFCEVGWSRIKFSTHASDKPTCFSIWWPRLKLAELLQSLRAQPPESSERRFFWAWSGLSRPLPLLSNKFWYKLG